MGKSRRHIDPVLLSQVTEIDEIYTQCMECSLWEEAHTRVLWRGDIPAKILFIGEGPGISEDTLGVPFIGPAGRVLNTFLAPLDKLKITYCITNLVACVPFDERKSIRKPHKKEVDACSSRLYEMERVVSPQFIVALGNVARDHLRRLQLTPNLMHMPHPAALLHSERQQDIDYMAHKMRLTINKLIKGISDAS